MKLTIASRYTVLVVFLTLFAALTHAQEVPVMVRYKGTDADFPNPERGFYRFSHTKASAHVPLDPAVLANWRKESKVEGGTYKIVSTLLFRYYEMDLFKDQPLSDKFLGAIAGDFIAARRAGIKMIPRFTYTLKQTAGKCPEGFICPPYGDAPKQMILKHIASLKQVLHDNADVIAVVQMGFIGVWGEQYYTDFFGDASQNTTVQKLTDANWQDRIEVLKALLAAVPSDRMIQVRYPQIKQRFVYGIKADVQSAPLTESGAFTETDQARIGFHNDCFLASSNDYGTFEDYGNSTTPRADANEALRIYKGADSKFVAVGGETCNDDFSPQNDCEPAGRAQSEMKAFHYSFLNSGYNNEVNNDWQKGGCMYNIRKNLGYRFVLKTGSFPASVVRGGSLHFSLELENEGYASPFNPRAVQLILRNKKTGKEEKLTVDSDPRRWFPGSVKIDTDVTLPAMLPAGQYDLFLCLPDPHAAIAARPEYAIRLANENTWDKTTGYNSLQTTVIIK